MWPNLAHSTVLRQSRSLGIVSVMAWAGCFAPTPATISPPEYIPARARVTTQPAGVPTTSESSSPQEFVRRPAVLPSTASPENLLPENFRPAQPERAWKYLVLHHSATEGATVEAIDLAHRQRKDSAGRPWLGIAYHFVIGNGQGMADGEVEPTFRWTEQLHGAHAGDREHNDHGIGICLVGNFEKHPPTPRQMAAARDLVAVLRAQYRLGEASVIPHGAITATDCPGRYFSIDELIPTTAPSTIEP
jgi:N-acetyl-anhydromuramyl-L-alanine amidase AmpD